jgi:hypothetical protein
MNYPPRDSNAYDWEIDWMDREGRVERTATFASGDNAFVHGIALSKSGQVLVVGTASVSRKANWEVRAYDHQARLKWNHSYVSSFGMAAATAVTNISSGGYLVVGSEQVLRSSMVNRELRVIRYRDDGGVVWSRSLATPSGQQSEAAAVCELSDGTFLVVGSTGMRRGTFDIHLAAWKFDGDGTLAWTLLDPRADAYSYGLTVASNSSGGAFVTAARIPATTELGADGYTLRPPGELHHEQNWYSAGIDGAGRFEWTRTEIGRGRAKTPALRMARCGNLFVAACTGSFMPLLIMNPDGTIANVRTRFHELLGIGGIASNEEGEIIGGGYQGDYNRRAWRLQKWMLTH